MGTAHGELCCDGKQVLTESNTRLGSHQVKAGARFEVIYPLVPSIYKRVVGQVELYCSLTWTICTSVWICHNWVFNHSDDVCVWRCSTHCYEYSYHVFPGVGLVVWLDGRMVGWYGGRVALGKQGLQALAWVQLGNYSIFNTDNLF